MPYRNSLQLSGCLMLLLSAASATLMENQANGLEQAPSVSFSGHRLRCYQQGDTRIVQPYIAMKLSKISRVRRDPVGNGFFFLVPLQITSNMKLPTTSDKQWHMLTVHRFKVELREAPCQSKCPKLSVSAEWRSEGSPLIRFRCDSRRDCQRLLRSLRFKGERSRSLRASLRFTFYGQANGVQYALSRVGLPVANTVTRPFRKEFWFEGDKLMLFTIRANIGSPAYEAYQTERNYQVPRDGSLPDLYRSNLVDRLSTVASTAKWEIVAEMRKDGRTVVQAVFSANPSGLNKDSWFTPARLLSTKPFWTGRSNLNVFSIVGTVWGGDARTGGRRRFIINKHWGGCEGADTGFFTVSDSMGGECAWVHRHFRGKQPTLVYSALESVPYSISSQSADNFLVYMRLARPSARSAPALPGAYHFEENKILLFTVAGHSNNAAADIFLNSGIRHPTPTGGMPALYRSELIDSLGTIFTTTGMGSIVAEMRAGNRVVSQVVFDISIQRLELNKENWFARNRVVSSYPYWVGDSFNFFSIRGHADVKRSFFISFNYGGCHVDRAFWVVSDQRDPCLWGHRHWNGHAPVLIYTVSREGPTLETGGARYDADRFLIYLK